MKDFLYRFIPLLTILTLLLAFWVAIGIYLGHIK